MSRSTAVLALRLIAAKAEKTANDLDDGRLWPGELEAALAEIAAALRDARS